MCPVIIATAPAFKLEKQIESIHQLPTGSESARPRARSEPRPSTPAESGAGHEDAPPLLRRGGHLHGLPLVVVGLDNRITGKEQHPDTRIPEDICAQVSQFTDMFDNSQ